MSKMPGRQVHADAVLIRASSIHAKHKYISRKMHSPPHLILYIVFSSSIVVRINNDNLLPLRTAWPIIPRPRFTIDILHLAITVIMRPLLPRSPLARYLTAKLLHQRFDAAAVVAIMLDPRFGRSGGMLLYQLSP